MHLRNLKIYTCALFNSALGASSSGNCHQFLGCKGGSRGDKQRIDAECVLCISTSCDGHLDFRCTFCI